LSSWGIKSTRCCGPKGPASRVLQWLKGVTARQANLLHGRTGQPFWQRESYDHVVREERELERIVAYVENNPVKAGLVGEACQYVWSSAWENHPQRDCGLKPAAAR